MAAFAFQFFILPGKTSKHSLSLSLLRLFICPFCSASTQEVPPIFHCGHAASVSLPQNQ